MRGDAPDRPLPVRHHSVGAEQAVLGALLIDTKAFPQIADIVGPADFYQDAHRLIFGAIARLADAGQPHDVILVTQALERAGQLEAAGGLGYLGRLARETPTAANVMAYATEVRERAALGKLGALAESLQHELAQPGSQSAAELIAAHQQALTDLQARARKGKGLRSVAELAPELVDDLDRRRDGHHGLRVGLADFDERTGGLEPGDLIVLAGRPGTGKSTLLVEIADHCSQQTPVAIFSAEMPSSQLMRRAVAKGSGISQGTLRRAERLTPDDWNAIGPAVTKLAERRLYIDDTALPTLPHVRAECMSLKARHGLGLVLVDYLQLVKGQGANRYEQLREVAYGLKALAKDLAVPVIALAQLNRGVEAREHKRPYISDLRDSGSIEEAADIVGLLYSEGYYDPEFGMPYVLECNIEKSRNGERGQCLWHFDGAHSRITVLDPGARAQYLRLRATQHRKTGTDDL